MTNILVYGAPLAGKRTLVELAAANWQVDVERFELQVGGLDVSGAVGTRLRSPAMEVTTLSGSVWDESLWMRLWAPGRSALALVLDPQSAQAEANEAALRRAIAFTGVRAGCVVLTKRDVWSAPPLELGPFGRWPVFQARSDQPEGAASPFRWLASQCQ